MRNLCLALIGAFVIALAFTAPTHAAPPTIDPGDSAADQYTEGVPDAKGNKPTPDRRSSGGRTGSSGAATGSGGGTTASQSALAALSQLGNDGSAAAEVVAVTAPERERTGQSGGSDGSDGRQAGQSAPPEEAEGASPAAGLFSAFTGEENGLGWLLPVLLGAALAGALAFAMVRSRSS
jgi:hypothetical protein